MTPLLRLRRGLLVTVESAPQPRTLDSGRCCEMVRTTVWEERRTLYRRVGERNVEVLDLEGAVEVDA